ncbi:MAG: hypothetical protein A2X22_14405 [Bacteroidetes bacterium GWF2_49_14]|nr:MAG: hypothetical protein A2X22_14405 [Bacteroidetes bacterium GWF2_49_14]
MGYGWILGITAIVIILVLIGVIINQKRQYNRLKNKSPLDIIKDRYAKGEISKEEFEDKRRALIV